MNAKPGNQRQFMKFKSGFSSKSICRLQSKNTFLRNRNNCFSNFALKKKVHAVINNLSNLKVFFQKFQILIFYRLFGFIDGNSTFRLPSKSIFISNCVGRKSLP